MRSAWLPVLPLHVANVEMLVALHRLTLEDEGLLFRALRLAWAARGLGERPQGMPDRVWAALDAAWESIEEARLDAEEMAARRKRQTAAATEAAAKIRNALRNGDTQRLRNDVRNGLRNGAILRQKTKDTESTEYPEITPSQEVTPVRSRRSRRAPANFRPSDEHLRVAAERDVDLDAELAKFRDHEFAHAKSDWPATFRNWLRNASPRRRHPVDLQVRRMVAGTADTRGVWERLDEQAQRVLR